jgi:hypothetical protein
MLALIVLILMELPGSLQGPRENYFFFFFGYYRTSLEEDNAVSMYLRLCYSLLLLLLFKFNVHIEPLVMTDSMRYSLTIELSTKNVSTNDERRLNIVITSLEKKYLLVLRY